MQGIMGKEKMNKALASCSPVLTIQKEHLHVIKSRRHVEARLCWKMDVQMTKHQDGSQSIQ